MRLYPLAYAFSALGRLTLRDFGIWSTLVKLSLFQAFACLLYHTPTREHVARTDTLHLDTYSMRAGKISGTHGGEKGKSDKKRWKKSAQKWVVLERRRFKHPQLSRDAHYRNL